MSQVTGSLTPVWETWIGFQAPGFNLFQPKPLWAFGKEAEDGSSVSPPALASQKNKIDRKETNI